jgi:hypothetical protein
MGLGAAVPRNGAGILFLSQKEAAILPARIAHSATIACELRVADDDAEIEAEGTI